MLVITGTDALESTIFLFMGTSKRISVFSIGSADVATVFKHDRVAIDCIWNPSG